MQRKADDIFRVKDLSLLKSPIPGHIRSCPTTPHQKTELDNFSINPHLSQQKIFAPSPGIARPSFLTPKPMMAPPPMRLKPSPLIVDAEFPRKETKIEEDLADSIALSNTTPLKIDQNSSCILESNINEATVAAPANIPIDENREIPENIDVQSPETSMKAIGETTQSRANECLLQNWYFQKIPNNPKFSKVERDVCEEWVVLVGTKPEMSELWHSSIVTGRIDEISVSTGSGKVYRLLDFDEAAFIEAGFDATVAKKFRNGFPEDWQEILIKSLKIEKKQQKSATPSSKRMKSSHKTPCRRSSLPSAFISETPTVLGATRSGRKVVTPIPFWDSKVAATYKASPSLNIKRRWGNTIVYEKEDGKSIL